MNITNYIKVDLVELDGNEIMLENLSFINDEALFKYKERLCRNHNKAKYISGLLMGDLRDYWGEFKENRLETIRDLLRFILKYRKDKKVEEDLRFINTILEGDLIDFDGKVLINCNLYIDTSYLRVKNLTIDDLVYIKLCSFSSVLLDKAIEILLKRVVRKLILQNTNIVSISPYVAFGSSLKNEDLAEILKIVKKKLIAI